MRCIGGERTKTMINIGKKSNLVLSKPLLILMIFGHQFFDQPPETGRMVMVNKVRRLMHHDIAQAGGRGHDQPPVKG